MVHRFAFLSFVLFALTIGVVGAATPPPAYPGGLGCQKDTGAAAWLAPCIGPEGTVIAIYPLRALKSAPAKLVFKPDFPIPGGAALMHEILTITGPGLTLKAPKELCAYPAGPGAYSRAWDVELLTADGKNLGRIGVYTMKCGPGATPSPSVTAAPAPPAKCGSGYGASAAIAPCAGPPGTRIGIYPLRPLHDVPDLLRFERVAGSACYAPACGATVVLAKIMSDGSYSVSAPSELCVYGPKWSTFVFGKAGTAFGLAGVFTIDCRTKPGAKNTATPKPGGGGGGGGGGNKATPKPSPSPSPSPSPTPKRTATPKPAATPTPKPQSTQQAVTTPGGPNAAPSPKPSFSAIPIEMIQMGLTGSQPTAKASPTPSPKPTQPPATAPAGTCVPAPNSPIKLGTCNLFDTEMVQMTLVGTQPPPVAILFQLLGSTVPPFTAPVQPTTSGGLTFVVPIGICRHAPAQWMLFGNGPSGQVLIGQFNTNC